MAQRLLKSTLRFYIEGGYTEEELAELFNVPVEAIKAKLESGKQLKTHCVNGHDKSGMPVLKLKGGYVTRPCTICKKKHAEEKYENDTGPAKKKATQERIAREGVKRKSRGYTHEPDVERTAQLVRLISEGHSNRHIGKVMGVDERTVRRWLQNKWLVPGKRVPINQDVCVRGHDVSNVKWTTNDRGHKWRQCPTCKKTAGTQ